MRMPLLPPDLTRSKVAWIGCVLYAVLVIGVTSCGQVPEQAERQQIRRYLAEQQHIDLKNHTAVVLFIPSTGCAGCIKKTTELAASKQGKDNFYIVLTGTSKPQVRAAKEHFTEAKVLEDVGAHYLDYDFRIVGFPFYVLTEPARTEVIKVSAQNINSVWPLFNAQLSKLP